jgi:hypothetical protein
VEGGGELVSKPVFLSVCRESSEKRWRREAWEFIREVAIHVSREIKHLQIHLTFFAL